LCWRFFQTRDGAFFLHRAVQIFNTKPLVLDGPSRTEPASCCILQAYERGHLAKHSLYRELDSAVNDESGFFLVVEGVAKYP